MKKQMKSCALLASMLLSGSMVLAQEDPCVMTIQGNHIRRSELEFSYNQNNAKESTNKLTVETFANLFVDYKLKVQAALDARIDTLPSIKRELTLLQNHQRQKSATSMGDTGNMQKIYDKAKREAIAKGGMIRVSHILLKLPQQASPNAESRIKRQIDSIYVVLQNGADFAKLAQHLSDDRGTAYRGGDIGWLIEGQSLPSFEKIVFALKENEVSKPFMTEFGYHVAVVKGRQDYSPFDSVKKDLQKTVDAENIHKRIVEVTVNADTLTEQSIPLDLQAQDFYEGLLASEISDRIVWEKVIHDEDGLKAFYKKNKKQYMWREPRYRLNDGRIVKELPASMSKKQAKKLKKPKNYLDVKEWVIADYQDLKEKEWVASLRKKYAVVINQAVLATVNKHK